MEVKALIKKIDIKTKDEILRKMQYKDLRIEEDLVEIAQLLLPFTEDEAFCSAFDYLHCKLEHQKYLQKIKEQATKQGETINGFNGLRHEFKNITYRIIEYIRYGKRSSQIDELLTQFVMLDERIASLSQRINISGDAPSRCSHCNKDCLASYRIMFGIISSILNELKL